jgi:glycosyltransferase involved in cell wall biosynthesis
MKKRILFITVDLDIGGTQWHLVQLLPELVKRGIEPTVYTIRHKGRLADILEGAGIEVIAPPFAKGMRFIPQPLRRIVVIVVSGISLYLLLWRRRRDYIHFFLPMAYLMGGLLSLFVPVKIRIMSRRSMNLYQRAHPVLVRIERWLHQFVDAALANAKCVVAELREEGVSESKLGLIYNGIDLRRFEGLPSRRETRAELGIDENAYVMTMAANYLASKGHADLLTALALIRDELPSDWHLLLAGEDHGSLRALQEQTARSGLGPHIHFLGGRKDIPALLGASDIGILSSHQEGFSNSVLEGMAARLPMIVTRTGGNPEAITDRQNGIVVPVSSPKELGDAILVLAADRELGRRYAENARARVESEFTIDACAERYCRFYAGLGKGEKVDLRSILPNDD